VFVKKLQHGLLRLDRVIPLEAVAGTFQREEFDFDLGGFQLVVNPGGLFVGDIWVLGPVN
jgi:hypothetical protein